LNGLPARPRVTARRSAAAVRVDAARLVSLVGLLAIARRSTFAGLLATARRSTFVGLVATARRSTFAGLLVAARLVVAAGLVPPRPRLVAVARPPGFETCSVFAPFFFFGLSSFFAPCATVANASARLQIKTKNILISFFLLGC
jgi:hypothetical protein